MNHDREVLDCVYIDRFSLCYGIDESSCYQRKPGRDHCKHLARKVRVLELGQDVVWVFGGFGFKSSSEWVEHIVFDLAKLAHVIHTSVRSQWTGQTGQTHLLARYHGWLQHSW
jgi:hypothetical protein